MLGTRIPSSRKIVQYKTMVLYTGFFPVHKTMVLLISGCLMLRKNRYVYMYMYAIAGVYKLSTGRFWPTVHDFTVPC